MKVIIITCLALIASSLAQSFVEIGAPRPPTICLMMSPPKIPDGCHLELTSYGYHCPIPKVICPSCDLLKCEGTQQCRVVDRMAECFEHQNHTNKDCGENMEIKRCGTTCPETCKHHLNGISPICTSKLCLMNVCQCKEGYVLDHNKKCVPRNACNPFKCKKNEVLKFCGTMCPETCEMVNSGRYPHCSNNCKILTCHCKKGYVLDENKKCVPRNACIRGPKPYPIPINCKKNEVWKRCGTRCPVTCEMVIAGRYPPPCPKICEPNVCQCKKGYVLDENKKCVPLHTCIKRPIPFHFPDRLICKKNEVWKRCGTRCPETCEMVITGKYPPCPLICKPYVCQCKKGYVLDKNKKCVPRNTCKLPTIPALPDKSSECKENEEKVECGTACPETCEHHVTGKHPNCTKECIKNACQCKKGYVLDKNKECVARNTCKLQITPRLSANSTECGENETVLSCLRCPQRTCKMVIADVYPPCPPKGWTCDPTLCQCKDGFAFHDEIQRCIEKEYCHLV